MSYILKNNAERKRVAFLLMVVFTLIISSVNGQIISNNRRIEWTPGIPGGIPEKDGPVTDIIEFGADNGGQSDCSAAFRKALEAIPNSGGVIYFPAGTYFFAEGLKVRKSNVVIRGAGPEKSRLLFRVDDECISVSGNQQKRFEKVISGYEKGSNVLVVEEPAKFEEYEFVEMRQENNADLMYTQDMWDQNWSKHSVGQILEVERVETATKKIYLKTPLHIGYNAALTPELRPVRLTERVGIEDLYIERLEASDDHTFSFQHTAFAWLRNVESNHTFRSHVFVSASFRCEIRDSYFHHSFDYGGGGHGYGVELNRHTTNVLVENNIFDSLRHAMLIQVGANGNVYGYNYSVNPVQGDGEENLNRGWIPPDISIHGHYPYMNLFEGNEVSEIGIGDYWGPAGPGNTYFRNHVAGEGVFFYDQSHQQNLVANIITAIVDEQGKAKQKLEVGNVIDGGDYPNKNAFPDSYYLEKKPEFFESFQWPAIGPDIKGFVTTIPAKHRYNRIIENSEFQNK